MRASHAKKVVLIACVTAVILLVLVVLVNLWSLHEAGNPLVGGSAGLPAGASPWLGTIRIMAGKNASLPIAYLGDTNDAHGERLAIFAITNLLPRQVECMTAVENKEGAGWLPVTFSSPSFAVAPNQGCVFTVAKPNVGSWRVAILYQNKPTVVDEIGLSMRRLLYRLRLDGVAKKVPTERLNYYSVFGSEMTN